MTQPDTVLLCHCTCPDAGSARTIAETLVVEQLAACVNQLGGIRSTYRWEGATTTDDEVLLLIKTTESRFEALKGRLLSLHPYDLPELIAVPISHAHAPYLDWVHAATRTET